MNKKVVIMDLDGTLACGKHRLHLLPDPSVRHTTADWDTFNLAASGDSPIQSTIDVSNSLAVTYRIVILTGRCDIAKDITLSWLSKHGVVYDELTMRPAGDNRKDTEFKEEVIRSIGMDNILCAFDDLEHVVRHLRALGVTSYLVTHYDDKRVGNTPQEDKHE